MIVSSESTFFMFKLWMAMLDVKHLLAGTRSVSG